MLNRFQYENGDPLDKSRSPQCGENVANTLLVAALFDPTSSLSRLPKDVILDILRYFVPNPHGPYLLHKPIARSYYQICRMMVSMEEEWERYYCLSTTNYDARFQSNVNLAEAAPHLIAFLVETQKQGIVFSNYSNERLGTCYITSPVCSLAYH
jgi:hypothetical protein